MNPLNPDPSRDSFAVVDASIRLPRSPFRIPGTTDICQFNWAIGGKFAPVLRALAEHYGDTSVIAGVIEPDPVTYYENGYGYHPKFSLLTSVLTEGALWERLSFEPEGDPTGAIAFTADIFAIEGSSGQWGVWAQRDWDVALIRSDVTGGQWLAAGVPFTSVDEALTAFVEPDFKTPLSAGERDRFRRIVSLGLMAGES